MLFGFFQHYVINSVPVTKKHGDDYPRIVQFLLNVVSFDVVDSVLIAQFVNSCHHTGIKTPTVKELNRTVLREIHNVNPILFNEILAKFAALFIEPLSLSKGDIVESDQEYCANTCNQQAFAYTCVFHVQPRVD